MWLFCVPLLAAHPMSYYAVDRSVVVEVQAEELRLHYTADYAELSALSVLIERSRVGTKSWEQGQATALARGLLLQAPTGPVVLESRGCMSQESQGEAGLARLWLSCVYTAPRPEGALQVEDHNYPGLPGHRELRGVGAVESSDPPGILGTTTLPFLGGPEVEKATLRLEAPLPVLAGGAGIGTALLLGIAHALAPGHGKSLVASYLIGSRATVQHALLLGATVVLTHMISVVLLGGLMIWLLPLSAPGLYPWLGALGGAVVMGIGARLWRRAGQEHPHHHPHSHRELLLLGATGGLLPCPLALVGLLGAASLGKVWWGGAMISAFALGLA
ncbi:MAG TPA: sulfite exporter TauE/SafE family protein, partial [Myxococcota bacterium]|nr:sulfite exporter TauE/SafE family protein [Myxococcota bacterium]